MHDRAMDGMSKCGGRRRWRVAAVAVAGLVLAGAGGRAVGQAAGLLRAKTASATIRMSGGTAEQLAESASAFRSQPILLPALRSTKVAALPIVAQEADPVLWLTKALQVQVLPGTTLVQLSLESPKPDQAAVVVDAVVDAYLEEVVKSDRAGRDERAEELTRARSERLKEAQQTREELRLQSRSSGGDVLGPRLEMEAQDLRENRRELRRIRLELAATEVRLARRRVDKAAVPIDLALLEENAAVLKAQANLLLQSEEKNLDALRKFEEVARNLKDHEADLTLAEEAVRAISEQLDRLKAEAQDAPNVRVLRRAQDSLR